MNLAPDTKHGTISHDCLTTAMFSSAQTCYFLPRVCVQKNNGAQWRTFYNFASYNEAHTPALQDIKRGNSSSCGAAEVTPHMATQRAQSGGQRVCIGTRHASRMQRMATDNTRGQQHMLKPCHKTTPDVWDKKKVKPNRTTQGQ